MEARKSKVAAFLLAFVILCPLAISAQQRLKGESVVSANPNPSVRAFASAEELPDECNVMYAVDLSLLGSNLLTISPQTGAGTVIGNTGVPGIYALAFTPDGKLYGISGSQMLLIDPNTAETSYVGSGLGISSINAMVSDNEGSLYGATSSGQFLKIDPVTGSATLIGEFGAGYTSSGDLAIGPDGTFYAVSPGYPYDTLLRVNPQTGAAVAIGSIGFGQVYGMAFDSQGELLATANSASIMPVLVVLSTTTGAGSKIGTITNAKGIGDLTYWKCSSQCTSSCVASVPATGQIGAAISFAATATVSVDCTVTPTFLWDFGDGSISTDQNPSHSYTTEGTYQWTLTVSIAGASACTKSGTITVSPSSNCMTVGAVSVCADGFTPTSAGWTAQGHVEINGFLQTDGMLTFNSTAQTISGNDGLYVQTTSILGKITVFPASFTLNTSTLTFLDFSSCDQPFCQFDLSGLPVTITDATLSSTQLSLQAKLDVSAVLQGINELAFQLTVDASGVELGGCLGVSNATIPGTTFAIPDAELCYTPATDTWGASLIIHIPSLMPNQDEEIKGSLQVSDGCLNQVGVSGSGLNIPIFGGEAILDSLGAEFGNLCQGGYPYFKGSCGIDLGPKIAGYSLLSANPIDVIIDTQPSLTIDGQLKLVLFPVANGSFKLGPGPVFSGILTAAIPAEALPIILFHGDMDGGLNPNWYFQATGTASVQIPSTIPVIGGLSLAQAQAHIDQNGVYAQGSAGICPICTSFCAHVDWNGNFSDQCWTQEASQSIRSLNTGLESTLTLTLSQPTAQALFGIQWQQGDLDFTLSSPSGVTYTPSSENALYVKNSAAPSAFYIINDPEEGVWTLTVPSGQYGSITTGLMVNNNLSVPNLTSPAQDLTAPSGSTLSVGWTMTNPQPDGAIELFLSPTYPPTQSQLLATVSADKASGSSPVTIPTLTPGAYYLYTIYNDSAEMPRYSVAPGRIVVQNTSSPYAPYILGIDQSSTSVTLQWESSQQGNIQGYDLYWSPLPFAGSFANEVGIGNDSNSYTISELVPGHSYEVGVSAFDTSGLNGPISHESVILNTPGQNQPQITSIPSTTAVVGMPYSYTLTLQNLDDAPVVYSLAEGPSGMSISSSGVVEWTPQSSDVGQVDVVVQVAREDSASTIGDTQTYPLSIASPDLQRFPPQIVSSPVQSVLPGQAYRYACSAQDPQGEEVTWNLAQGPAGMDIDSQGVLTWSQTAPFAGQSVHVIISAINTDNLSATQDYWLKVGTNNCPTITLSPSSLASGTAGTAYPSTAFSQNGSGGTITWSESGALPTGMTFASGVLSGTPIETGTFPITVTAANANGCTGRQGYTLRISCPALAIFPTSLPNGAGGKSYTQTIGCSGGIGPYTFSVTAGNLPAGLSLTSSGLLSGTPTAGGDFSFKVTAVDANGCSVTASYAIVVVPPPVVNSLSKMGSPFRIKVYGSNLQEGLKVYINGQLWGDTSNKQLVKWKSASNIVIKKGATLKSLVPKNTATTFRFVNPDGGEATVTWQWP